MKTGNMQVWPSYDQLIFFFFPSVIEIFLSEQKTKTR